MCGAPGGKAFVVDGFPPGGVWVIVWVMLPKPSISPPEETRALRTVAQGYWCNIRAGLAFLLFETKHLAMDVIEDRVSGYSASAPF